MTSLSYSRGVQTGGGAVALAVLAALVAGAAPGTAPSADLPQRVRDLGDGDPEVRDRARSALMALDRSSLPQLRDAVVDMGSLAPGQAAELQRIVSHVYLSGERDPVGEGEAGFLGVKVSPASVEVAPGPGVRAEGMPVGLAVAERVPGFDGYRMLQDGDVILRLVADKPYEFRSSADFVNVVRVQKAGTAITLDVLRRGRLIKIPITLDRRPKWADQELIDAALAERDRRAVEYWEQAFGSLAAQARS